MRWQRWKLPCEVLRSLGDRHLAAQSRRCSDTRTVSKQTAVGRFRIDGFSLSCWPVSDAWPIQPARMWGVCQAVQEKGRPGHLWPDHRGGSGSISCQQNNTTGRCLRRSVIPSGRFWCTLLAHTSVAPTLQIRSFGCPYQGNERCKDGWIRVSVRCTEGEPGA